MRLDALLSERVTATTILSWYRNTEFLDFEADIYTENRVVNVEDPERQDLLTTIGFDRERAVRDLALRQEIGIQFGDRQFVETGFELHGIDSSLYQNVRGPQERVGGESQQYPGWFGAPRSP